VVKLAEDRERGRERLDGGELHRTPEVHGVGGDEVRERAMLAGRLNIFSPADSHEQSGATSAFSLARSASAGDSARSAWG